MSANSQDQVFVAKVYDVSYVYLCVWHIISTAINLLFLLCVWVAPIFTESQSGRGQQQQK